MNYKHKLKEKKAFSLVEVLLTVSMLAIMTSAVFGAIVYGQQSNAISVEHNQATLIAQEGLEAVESLRDEDFTNLADGTYGLSFATNKWELVPNDDTTGKFTRVIQISTVDQYTKEIVSTVNWTSAVTNVKQLSLTSRLYDIYRYSPIALTGWQTPTLASSYDIPGNDNAIGIELYLDKFTLITSGNSNNIQMFDISSIDSPSLLNSRTILQGLNDHEMDENNTYLATNISSQEMIIYDSSGTTFLPRQSIDLTGKKYAQKIGINETHVFVGKENDNKSREVEVFEISTDNTISKTSEIEIGSTIYEVEATNDYLFLGVDDKNAELQIYDITDPTNPVQLATYDFDKTATVKDIKYQNDKLFVGLLDGTIQIFEPNVTPSYSLGTPYSINIGSEIYEMEINSNASLLFTTARDSAQEFQVWDIQALNAPTLYGVYDAPGYIIDFEYVESNDRVYAATEDNSQEILVLKPL